MDLEKIIEFVKLSGWRLSMIAAASAAIYWLFPPETFAGIGDWFRPSVLAVCIISAFMAAAPLLERLHQLFKPEEWMQWRLRVWNEKRRTENYISNMNDTEKEIIAYLLHHNIQSFTNKIDGGEAATLMARRIIIRTSTGTGYENTNNIPMTVPDHIWAVLQKNRDKFPIQDVEPNSPHPWRRSWVLD